MRLLPHPTLTGEVTSELQRTLFSSANGKAPSRGRVGALTFLLVLYTGPLMYKENTSPSTNVVHAPHLFVDFFFFFSVLGQLTKLFKIKQNQLRTKFTVEQ